VSGCLGKIAVHRRRSWNCYIESITSTVHGRCMVGDWRLMKPDFGSTTAYAQMKLARAWLLSTRPMNEPGQRKQSLANRESPGWLRVATDDRWLRLCTVQQASRTRNIVLERSFDSCRRWDDLYYTSSIVHTNRYSLYLIIIV
jgi:hypothetical protein